MTEGNEMLERAINYAKENVTLIGGDYQAVGEMLCAFAEQETKRLQEQIEKMKCCGNCKSQEGLTIHEPCVSCKRCYGKNYKDRFSDNWKLKE